MPTIPQQRNERVAAGLGLFNLGLTWAVKPEAWILWAALAGLFVVLFVELSKSSHQMTKMQQTRLLLGWALALIILVVLGPWLFEGASSLLLHLLLLGCFPLWLSFREGASKGLVGFLAVAVPGWLLNAGLLAAGAKTGVGVAVALALVTGNLLAALFLLFTTGPSRRNPHSTLARSGTALRCMAACAGLSMLAAAPLAGIVHGASSAIAERKILPNWPAASTSSATVFTARFEGDAPERPYWRHYKPYAWPVSEYEWVALGADDQQWHVDWPGLYEQDVLMSEMESLGPKRFRYTKEEARMSYSAEDLEGTFHRERLAGTSETQQEAMEAYQSFKNRPWKGLTPALEMLYLSIPLPNQPLPSTQVTLEGARQNMPRTWALVQGWRQTEGTDEAFIDRTLAYFNTHLAYNFDHQSTDPTRNRVDHFLFEERKGVCRHFANAFAMIMRMGGVPSRLVGGYAGGHFDPAENAWVVRKRDAHVWVEVWLDGRGWVRVDPTAGVPVEKGIPENKSEGAGAWLGYAKTSWSSLFSTAGHVSAPSATSSPTPSNAPLQKLPHEPVPTEGWMGLCAVLALLALLVWCWQRGWFARVPRPPAEERAWVWAKAYLQQRGHALVPSQGPATVGRTVAKCAAEPHRSRWLAAVGRYERWKFADEPSPGLARELRQAARAVGRHHSTTLTESR